LLGYPIELSPDDNGTVLITCPDLPEVASFAADEREAPMRAGDAIEEALAHRIADGEDVPAPSPAQGRLIAALPTLSLVKIELYRAMRANGLSAPALADRLGLQTRAVERMLDLDHSTPMPQLDAAFRALGKRLGIEVWAA
jgi:antitoxin HicB